ncbi:MAG: putative RDD family membrane protein YckC [Crocinitomix sp.]|jgi:uncharacterized RDD family membrane protein YckC
MTEVLDSVDSIKLNVANQARRFGNLAIDFIVISILHIFVSAVFDLFHSGNLIDTIQLICISLTYYTLCEFFMGKTIGKLFTKTKVVTEKGLRPDFAQCVQRSLSRLMVIEVFSYIPEYPIGWHDKWSRTRVVKV